MFRKFVGRPAAANFGFDFHHFPHKFWAFHSELSVNWIKCSCSNQSFDQPIGMFVYFFLALWEFCTLSQWKASSRRSLLSLCYNRICSCFQLYVRVAWGAAESNSSFLSAWTNSQTNKSKIISNIPYIFCRGGASQCTLLNRNRWKLGACST